MAGKRQGTLGKTPRARKGVAGKAGTLAGFPDYSDAFRLAFAAARERHLQAGVPMVFYENGKVVEIDAKKVRLPTR